MKYLLILILIISSYGCCLLKGKAKIPEATAALPQERLLHQSNILNEERFKAGGKILVVPFTPGVNTAATDELDGVSMMIVKGIADSLVGQSSPFMILDAVNAEGAELILQGRILTMQESGRLKKMTFRRNPKSLAVEGNMIDVKTGEIVFHFTDTKEGRDKKQTFRELGSAIGRDIGGFLTSSID